MRILVLGGTGFIGSHIVDALIDNGYLVRVIDRTLKHINRERSDLVEYIQADYSDRFVLLDALAGIDIVLHFVSSTIPSSSNMDPIADIQTNLVSSVGLLQAMQQSRVKRIIYFSSGGTVYGNPVKLPISEEHQTQPICSYGITKLAIEKYLYLFQELYGFRPVVLRLSNPYGPRQGHMGTQGVIGTFLRQALDGKMIKIWGDGSVVRDYIYIDDVVSACLSVIKLDVKEGVFNIGSGCGESLLNIAKMIEHCTERAVKISFDNERGFDVKEVVLDIKKAQEALNWKPLFSLEDGVRQHTKWLLNRQ